VKDRREHTIDASSRKLFDWKELFYYKELFYFFTWRDIKVKYKQTLLGFVWTVLQPLLMTLVFTLSLGSKLHDPSQKLAYPVFVFTGMVIWTIFSSGLTNAANSMVTNAAIIKKIYFPRLIIPVSSILVALFDFFMAMVVFVAVLIFYQQPVSSMALIYWPASLILTVMATLGPGCLLAAMNVKYRDFRYVIPFLVQFLFFLTPVMYSVSIVEYPILQKIIVLSPMYAAVELFRAPLSGTIPEMTNLTISLVSGFVFLLAGLIYFKRTEDFFADFA
jgi:lipopolysaccharide transport system permease protein